MVLYPEIQVKAWEELDRVVGNGRLPEFADRPNLPYVEAICLETFRWFPVVPDGGCVDPGTLASAELPLQDSRT